MKILIACLPKSGSTYLCMLIGNLPGFSIKSYVPDYGRREQEICETVMARQPDAPHEVAQHHVRCSDHTLNLLQKFGVKPIVLVRNLYDASVSEADHLVNESPVGPTAYFDEHIANLPLQDRINAALDLAAPWAINFYVSWWRARPDAIVTYEDLILGGPERQTSYLQSIGIDTNLDEVTAAAAKIKSMQTRFNVGKAGRGSASVDASRRRQVERMSSYYPDVDFSPLGIDRMLQTDDLAPAGGGFVQSLSRWIGKRA